MSKLKNKADKAKKPASKRASKRNRVSAPIPDGKSICVEQIASPIRRQKNQRQTLIGLGLNKMHRRSVLEDRPEIRGMINAISHLVKVIKNP